MRHRISIQFLLILSIANLSVKCSAQSVILGILEENRGHRFGDANYRAVRVVFEKQGDGWNAFRSNCRDQACLKIATSSYPSEVKWTIAFDGKNVGEVVSRNPNDFRWYSDVGQQVITNTSHLPTIGVRSPEFGGYTDATVYRPLVASSKPYFVDPDKWKPSAPPSILTTLLRDAFRNRFPKLCRTNQTDETKLEPFPYDNDQVKIVKTYASSAGSYIARLHLEAVDCQDTEAGFSIDDPWFSVDTNKVVKYLDSGMWLVDSGDYDNDGKSELIFSISRDNEGGYEIWYDNLQKHATFNFNYH